MKALSCLSFFLISIISFAQQEVLSSNQEQIVGKTAPLITEKGNPLFVINNIIISDSSKIDYFRKNYTDKVLKVKFLDEDQAFKEYKMRSKDGMLLIYMKKNVIVFWN